jgi:hypothetical protein
VFEHLIAGVWNYIKTCKRNGRKSKDFEFCYYILAVSFSSPFFSYLIYGFIFVQFFSFFFLLAGYFMFYNCIFLQVYYLDSLDFGARTVDQTVPRITIWKGNLIKFFSDLDHRKNNLFGKRQLKKNLPPCYNEVCCDVYRSVIFFTIMCTYCAS